MKELDKPKIFIEVERGDHEVNESYERGSGGARAIDVINRSYTGKLQQKISLPKPTIKVLTVPCYSGNCLKRF